MNFNDYINDLVLIPQLMDWTLFALIAHTFATSENGRKGQQADVQVIIRNVRSILIAVIAKNENAGVDCCTASGSNRPIADKLGRNKNPPLW
ncbi:hypothetical protein N9H39_11540 [Gammaproteobacteria bacterium]|nr:hypothetical protein [Gammaproteobacteria bacterium]